MKKIVFTLMMIFAFALIANNVKAQDGTKTSPYKGGTYSYALTGIEVNTTGYAVIEYDGSDATITNVEGSGVVYVAGTQIVVSSGSVFELNFDIEFGDAAGDGTLKVTVTDGAVDGCTNHITWDITPVDAPELDLVISTTSTDPYCQAITGTTNNVNAATGSTNNIIFKVSPTTDAGTGYTYDFDFAASPSDFGTYTIAKESGTGDVALDGSVTNANGDIEILVTWTTTTGLAPTDIVGTISNSFLNISVEEGGDIIGGTESIDTADITVKSTPTIGTFQ